MNEIKNRKRGALLGLAIGDALGAAVEFQERGTFEPIKGYRGGGPHICCQAGDWTDDTSMALAMGDSLGEKGWDALDQMCRYVKWMDSGDYTIPGYCFDIGNVTQSALMKFQSNPHTPFCGPTDDEASGNGSIMRLAPLSIYFADLYPSKLDVLADYAKMSSQMTHGSCKCYSACEYMALIMAAFINGETKEDVLNNTHSIAQFLLNKTDDNFSVVVKDIIKGSYRSGKNICGSGYVCDSLEAALWAFWHTNDFKEAVLSAINLGDDTDTTGAVCGQMAGAYYGESGIPTDLLDGLGGKQMIENVLEKLVSKE
jgi:ADP-ribosyl-[dinitrogen reductase] hydrolase